MVHIELRIVSALPESLGNHVVVEVDPDWTFEDLVAHLESGPALPFNMERGGLKGAHPVYRFIRPGNIYECYGPTSTLTVGEASCSNEKGYHRQHIEEDHFQLSLHQHDDLLVYITDADQGNKVFVTSLQREAVPSSQEGFLKEIARTFESQQSSSSSSSSSFSPSSLSSLSSSRGLGEGRTEGEEHSLSGLGKERESKGVHKTLWPRHFDLDSHCSHTLQNYLRDQSDPSFMTVVHVRAHRSFFTDVGIRNGWQLLLALLLILCFLLFGVPGAEHSWRDVRYLAGELGTTSTQWLHENVIGQ